MRKTCSYNRFLYRHKRITNSCPCAKYNNITYTVLELYSYSETHEAQCSGHQAARASGNVGELDGSTAARIIVVIFIIIIVMTCST
jgi:hypothetical protein